MVEHVGSRSEDGVQRRLVPLAVGDQDLDRGIGRAPAYGPDGGRETGRSAVGEVVSGDTGDDRVLEVERRDGGGDPRRLVRIEGQRLAGVDETESAGPCASIAEDHEGRGAVRPALVDVRAAGFLTDGVEVEGPHQPLGGPVALTEVGADPHPFRSPEPGLLGRERDTCRGEAAGSRVR